MPRPGQTVTCTITSSFTNKHFIENDNRNQLHANARPLVFERGDDEG